MSNLKYLFLFLSFLFVNFTILQAQNLKEKQSITSKILGESVNYSIYFPPNYNASNRNYPVTYVLHGYTDDETAWVQFGEIDRQADAAILSGKIPPMILVMPDAKVTWYVNDASSKKRYEDFFIEEFIPHIDKTYRTRAKKEFRGITGLSMGGYGSFLYAIKHPDLFAASVPLSAAFYTEEKVITYEQERWNNVEGLMYGKDLKGQERITEHWKANNPFEILKTADKEELKTVKYWIDCGDDDFLYEGNSKMHIVLRDMEIPHEFRIRDGAHNWTYWRTGIIDALAFIGKSFKR
jgi:S-formylglutathione hydrolase FrmB